MDTICRWLRYKGMYVTGAPDADAERIHDSFDATACWCLRTQKALGPDGAPVHRDTCRPGRACCPDREPGGA